MNNYKNTLKTKIKNLIGGGFKSVTLSVIVSVLFVTTLVTAATTINENINTAGTLTVTEASTLATTTISTDLTVDTDTFYVDSVNGRVGVGTTTPTGLFEISGIDNSTSGLVGLKFLRNLTGSSINQDNIRDLTEINPTGSDAAFASFDTSITAKGDYDYNHLAAYQNRITIPGNANVGYIRGFFDYPTFNGTGTLTNRYGITVSDVQGSGAVTNNYGLVIGSLTRGSTNHAIYTSDGLVRFGDEVSIWKTTGAASENFLKLKFSDALNAGASIGFWDRDLAEMGRIETTFNAVYDGSMQFYTYDGDINEVMRIDKDGNLGIGTTTPSAALEVNGGAVLGKVTADPCGTGFPEGVLFYNDTSDYYCFCDGAGVDKKVSDNSACF